MLFAFKASAYHTDANNGRPYVNIADAVFGEPGLTASRLYLYHVDNDSVVTGVLGDGVTYFPYIAVESYVLSENELSDWNSSDTDDKFILLSQLVGVTIIND